MNFINQRLTVPALVGRNALGTILHQAVRTEAAREADPLVEGRAGGLLPEGGAGLLTLVVVAVLVHLARGTQGGCRISKDIKSRTCTLENCLKSLTMTMT